MSAKISTVLGAKGLVGRQLASALYKQGKKIWCPDRAEHDKLFSTDLGTVYYCIGLTADYRQRPYDTVEAHVSFLSKFLERADFERLVYLSSTRLYDSLGSLQVAEDLNLNFSVSNPRHLYDLSKALGENLCLNSSRGRAKVARLSCVIGNSLNDEGFIASLLNKSINSKKIEIDSSPNFARDYISLEDVVALLINIAEQGKQSIYNVASGINVSNQSIFEYIKEITGCEIHTTSSASELAPLINVERVQKEFGFSPIGIKSIITKLVLSESLM